MFSQKLEFALKTLEKTIEKRLQDEYVNINQSSGDLLAQISELQKQVRLQRNEIDMLKTIVQEAISNLDFIISEVEKLVK